MKKPPRLLDILGGWTIVSAVVLGFSYLAAAMTWHALRLLVWWFGPIQ